MRPPDRNGEEQLRDGCPITKRRSSPARFPRMASPQALNWAARPLSVSAAPNTACGF